MGQNANPRRVLGARLRAPTVSALPRQRLDVQLQHVWDHRLGLVVAPAGCGKTTLLAQFSAAAAVPVAWYRAEAEDAPEEALIAHLGQALGEALGVPVSASSVGGLAEALERWPGDSALLVVDDLHMLHGTPSESALERLIGYLPRGITVLAGSRCVPAFNLSRLRLDEAVLELGADDLRFRSWEVERLFHDFYGEPLVPEDLAELARRTEGWAAGLQLFHLATRGKPPAQRHALLAALASRSKLVREYLARNVLDQLENHLREFLLRTSVLTRLTGPLCDELLGRRGSALVLEELERRQIFTMAVDDEGGYRYHEALRTHLDSMLAQRLGEHGVRAEYRRAGALLEGAGLPAEALLAYCRAEDDGAAARLLGSDGAQMVSDPGAWLEALPPALVAADPWLQLASARRYVSAGALGQAVASYQRAEAVFGRHEAADVCRRERRAVSLWLEPAPPLAGEWVDLGRAATQRDPLGVCRRAAALRGAPARAVQGLAACLGGRLREGRALLATATGMADATPSLLAGVHVVEVLAGLVTGMASPGPATADGDRVHRDIPWLDRVGRTASIPGHGGQQTEELDTLQGVARRTGDRWGGAVMALCEGMASCWAGRPAVEPLQQAADEFAALGAPVVEAWARAGVAVALTLSGSPLAPDAGSAAVESGTAVNSYGSVVLALRALAHSDPSRADAHRAAAAALVEAYDLQVADIPLPAPASAGEASATPPTVAAVGEVNGPGREPRAVVPTGGPALIVRCFGRFDLAIHGRPVPLGSVKPKARSALRLLAMRTGRPVHRETLLEALWPEADPRAATRCLQVAISSLRQLLEPHAVRGASTLLVRDGDSYQLVVPPGGDADVVRFDAALSESRAARASGDLAAAATALRAALDAYGGELLPEEGPAEWVLAERDRCRLQAAEAASELAEALLALGEPAAAAATCERGLAIDRFRDELWRLLITASEQAGRQVAAIRARHHYDAVIAELN